jgi:hypothetical protein
MKAIFTSGPAAALSPPLPRAKAAPAASAPPVPIAAEEPVSFQELEPMEASFADPVPGPDGSEAPPAVDADAQVVPCGCGAEILLAASDVGHTIQCPACADTMIVEGNRDPRTGATTITLRRVGALDDPDWKLEEFQ